MGSHDDKIGLEAYRFFENFLDGDPLNHEQLDLDILFAHAVPEDMNFVHVGFYALGHGVAD